MTNIMGKLPTVSEYMEYANAIDSMPKDIYRHLNFGQMAKYQNVINKIKIPMAQVTLIGIRS